MNSLSVFGRTRRAAAFPRLHSLAAAAALLSLAPVAWAAQDPVVVTAARTPERVSALAAEVSVIDRTQLDRNAGRTVGIPLHAGFRPREPALPSIHQTSRYFFPSCELPFLSNLPLASTGSP